MGKMVNKVDDDQVNDSMKKNKAIILSMTPFERENPSCLKASRKNRIAKGAGVKVMDVNKLINQLEQMQMLTKIMNGGKMPNMNALSNMQKGAGMPGMSKHTGSKKQKKSKKKKKK